MMDASCFGINKVLDQLVGNVAERVNTRFFKVNLKYISFILFYGVKCPKLENEVNIVSVKVSSSVLKGENQLVGKRDIEIYTS